MAEDPRNYLDRWRRRMSDHTGKEISSRDLAMDYARYDATYRMEIDDALRAEEARGDEVSLEDGAQLQNDLNEIGRMREMLRKVGR
jgi:hypothetical protein